MDAQTSAKPDIWYGIGFEVDEITMGRNVVVAKLRDFEGAAASISGAAQDRHLVNLKIAAERMAEAAKAISIISGQVQSLSAHLASVLAKHAARNGSGRE